MTRIVACLVVCLAALAVAAPAPLQRIETTIDVLVTDASGAPVRDLAAPDFEVRIEGVPVAVLHAAPAPATLTIAFLVDATFSQPLRRVDLQAAVRDGWIDQLQAGDRARFGLVGPTRVLTGWLPESRSTAATLALGLIDRAPSEPSPIWDALAHAIDQLRGEPGPRAILLLSDGRSNGNVLGLEDVASRALAADVSISAVSEASVIMLPQAGGAVARLRSDDSMKYLADATGGLFRPDGIAKRQLRAYEDPYQYTREVSDNPIQPVPIIREIMSSLRQRHRLTILVTPAAKARDLAVQVRRPGLGVTVRRKLQ